MDGGANLGAEPSRSTEKLVGDPLASRFGEDRDHAGATPVDVQVVTRRRHRRVGARRQGATCDEHAHGLVDLCGGRTLEHTQCACVLQRVRRPHDGRAACLPPEARAQLAGDHLGEQSGRHGGPSRRVDLAGVAQPLGHGEHGRQHRLHLLHAVVVLEFKGPDRATVVQPADAIGETEVEQLGQLRADLAGLPVDGVPAEEDEVEGPGSAQDGGQRARGGQGV